MSVDSLNSAAFAIDQLLVYQSITVATATADQRGDALTKLNLAMREIFEGAYKDESGRTQFHEWSFLKTLDIATHVFAVDAYVDDMPADWNGQTEDVVYAYDSDNSKAGMDLERISPIELEQKRRDDTDSGTPEAFCIRHKSFAAATGSAWELCIHPPTDTEVTLNSRYRADGALLTDSTSVYPRGLPGMAHVIVAAAKADEELQRGQVEGPERRKADWRILRMVRMDQEVVSDVHVQQSYSEMPTGLR